MVLAGVTDDNCHNNDSMALQSLVLVLDETCHERHFSNSSRQNGDETLRRTTDKIEGFLSKHDIDMLLTMFDTGMSSSILYSNTIVITTPSSTRTLSLLSPKLTSLTQPPPPTLLLVPLSPQSLSPPTSPLALQTSPSEASSRSSTSHKKHPQSNSSQKPLTYGREFLQLLSQSSYGLAHIVPVAVCKQGEDWNIDSLRKLSELGIRDILSVPCEATNIGGLYMVRIPSF